VSDDRCTEGAIRRGADEGEGREGGGRRIGVQEGAQGRGCRKGAWRPERCVRKRAGARPPAAGDGLPKGGRNATPTVEESGPVIPVTRSSISILPREHASCDVGS